jgi:hypothetical protein
MYQDSNSNNRVVGRRIRRRLLLLFIKEHHNGSLNRDNKLVEMEIGRCPSKITMAIEEEGEALEVVDVGDISSNSNMTAEDQDQDQDKMDILETEGIKGEAGSDDDEEGY